MKIIMVCISFFLFCGNLSAQSNTISKEYEIWDDEPAPNAGGDFNIVKAGGTPFDDDWEKKSYPIGNGYMGASLFGRTDIERIQITEKTLCNDGLYGLGGLTNFAEVFLDINHNNPENYRRTLNLNDAISSVSYTYEGVDYNRDYFISYPDNVIVVKLSANKKGKISFTLRPEIPYLSDETKNLRSGTVVAKDNLITLSGKLSPFNMNYEAQIKVINNGGDLSVSNKYSKGEIVVSNANSVVLLIATGTNYKLSQHIFNEQSQAKKLDTTNTPHNRVTEIIEKASNKNFDELLQVHLNDYQQLFSRVDINFDSKVPETPTNEQLRLYKEGGANKYLEELMFQYGRYLLISSSRKGGLPSGLQGVWSQYKVTPWTGGYWHNINVQMNYWGAFNANLAETFLPYIDYYNAYLPRAKKNATAYIQKHNPEVLSEKKGDNGWTIGTGAGPFKISGSGGHSGPGTGGFTTKLFWDYYDFTRDDRFLITTGYPAILGMSKFLSKTVKPSKEGLLLVDPSASPEQRYKGGDHYMTIGTTFDQGFVAENHNDLIKASNILGVNDPFLDLVKDQLTKLDPIIIGASGQIKEYREEVNYGDIGDKHHRHISHLCTLYPGTLINSTTPDWINASIVSLDLRGNNTTGWAMAHRMNARARTKDGNKAYDVYKKLIQEKTLDNLWTTHPPFQIDANFGCMAGVAEMLLQSHEGYIEPLPALPSEWENGEYRGLVARGNFEISAKWENGLASKFEINSRSGGACKIFYQSLNGMELTNSSGEIIPFNKETSDMISFQTVKGTRYIMTLTH